MKSKILIIGTGELGTALSFVLKQSLNNEVILWGRNPNLPEADIIFLAVPTKAISQVVSKIKNHSPVLVVLSKGLTPEGKTAVETTREQWTDSIINISGPMIAEEILQGKEAKAVIAGNNCQLVVNLFKNTILDLKETNDLIGLSWCGPLKNIYAIGLGMSEGEEKGNNYKGCFVQEAVEEMGEIIKFFGGKKETAFSVAGISDLIATGFSLHSSNFQLGVKLAKGEKFKKLTEGAMTALGLEKRLGDKITQWQLLSGLAARILSVL